MLLLHSGGALGLPANMAQRGMLPKFRPAAVGGAAARPTIRPVRPGPPPPPPAPPRKIQSGVAARRGSEQPRELENDREIDPPTNAYPEPPTQASAYAKRQASFEDETQARPEEDPHTARRHTPAPQAYAAPAQDYPPSEEYDRESYQQLQQPDDYPPASVGDMNVPFDALPSLAVQRPFDEYDREFVDRDPAAQIRAARESARMQRAHRAPDPEPTRREGSTEGSYEQSYEQPAPARNARAQVGSGARERPITQNNRNEASGPQRRDAWNGMRTAGYEAPMIPPAPRVPEDAPPGFVMGVQPIRALEGPMFPPALAPRPAVAQQMFAPQTPMGPMGGVTPVPMAGMAGVRPMTPPHGAMALPQQQQQRVPTGPVMPAAAYVQSAQKGQAIVSGGQSLSTTTGSKTGRFAWFVFGSAFGIAFAFFATGFAPKIVGGGHKEEGFPATPTPAMTAPPPQQPQQPMPQPGMQQPGMQQPMQQQQILPPGQPLPSNQLPPSGTMTNPSLLPSTSGPGSALGPPPTMGTVNGQSVPFLPATGQQTGQQTPPPSRGGYVRPSRPSGGGYVRPSRPPAPPRAPKGGGDGDDVPASREGGGSPGDILGDALK